MGAVTRWFCLTKASVSAGTRRIGLAVSTLLLGMLAFAAPASATTETFNYTGAAQTWTVPAGVTEATFDLYGAQGHGGCCPFSAFPGGLGGRATATIPSPPAPRSRSTSVAQGGTTLEASTAAAPPAPSASAAGVAAAPPTSASATMALADRVLVAGGGGGSAGAACENPFSGGDGGGLSGKPGTADTSTVCGGPGEPAAVAARRPTGAAPRPQRRRATSASAVTAGSSAAAAAVAGTAAAAATTPPPAAAARAMDLPAPSFRPGFTATTASSRSPTTTIDTLIRLVQELALPSGITTLLTKLNTAEDNLDARDTAGACNQLGAFISQVKLQSGKKIPTAGADQLIADANDVRTSLKCAAALTCAGQKATIVGTGGPDRLKGRRATT